MSQQVKYLMFSFGQVCFLCLATVTRKELSKDVIGIMYMFGHSNSDMSCKSDSAHVYIFQ